MPIYNKIEKSAAIGIIFITILEVYFAFKVLNEYKGIYQIEIFIPLLLQPFLYLRLFRKVKSHYKFRITIMVLISLFLPLTIYFTLPNFTYNRGKQIVEQYSGLRKDVLFVDYSFNKNTIPLVNNPKQLFVSNRAYYYEIESTDGKKYFIVNPITGELKQLSKDYWRNMWVWSD